MKRDPFNHITDHELLERYYADRNNEWLGVLLQRYTLLLLGVCMKYTKQEEEAKDCVQQIFVKIITELPKYKVEYFKSWIYTIARNHCLMKLRDQHGRPAALSDAMLADWDEDPGKNKHLEKDQLLELMEQSLEELGKEQKLCVTLFYLEKKSYQEIAETTQFTLLQVKSYIQNGKRNLKLLMERKSSQKSKS
ncbi:MAG TPA: sigma-70 family RNA polymerase sigma factor [Puia sp.]